MTRYIRSAGLFAAIFLAALYTAAPANAQATRTWISGVGDDANPCSRTAPCKTFAGAISKTAAGGEIDCLDPGGFGAVTITKSITLDCGGGIGGQVGSILVTGTNGVTINGASVLVKIRNLTINGIQQSGSPGLSGIKFLNGSALIVEHVGIFGMGGSSGNNGGVDFEPNTAATLDMVDVEVQFGLGDGVLLKPQVGGSVSASMTQVRAFRNGGAGVRADSTNIASGAAVNASLIDSVLSSNLFGLFAYTPASTGTDTVMLNHVSALNNSSAGVIANGASATVRMGSSTVSGNATGLATVPVATPGTISSYGNNQINGNTSADGSPTGSVIPLK